MVTATATEPAGMGMDMVTAAIMAGATLTEADTTALLTAAMGMDTAMFTVLSMGTDMGTATATPTDTITLKASITMAMASNTSSPICCKARSAW